MKRTNLIAALVGLVAISILAVDASAMYHPGMGVFMSRDPGAGATNRIGAGTAAPVGQFIPRDQYRDGANLYQYEKSNPVDRADPSGTIVVVASGLLRFNSDGNDAMNAIDRALAPRLFPYERSKEVVVHFYKLGGGGQGVEERIVGSWYDFIRRKRANRCSLEQFVVVGHSDGATALRHILNNGIFNKYEFKPAYIGFVDLVRLNYDLQANDNDHGATSITGVPTDTWVDNYRQINGAGIQGFFLPWKGHKIIGVNSEWTATKDLMGLNHFSIWHDSVVLSDIARNLSITYTNGIVRDVRNGRPTPWTRRDGDTW